MSTLSSEHLALTSVGVGDKHAAPRHEPAKLTAPNAAKFGVLPAEHWIGAATIADKLNSEAAIVLGHCLSFPSCLSIVVL